LELEGEKEVECGSVKGSEDSNGNARKKQALKFKTSKRGRSEDSERREKKRSHADSGPGKKGKLKILSPGTRDAEEFIEKTPHREYL